MFKFKVKHDDRSWTGGTSLSEALAADRRALDRLIAAYPALARFKDRQVLDAVGDTATLADLATAAAVPVDVLVRMARGESVEAGPWPDVETEDRPAWLAGLDLGNLERLDVRPDMAGRRDPFARVMDLAATIGEGQAFALDTLFEPAPLRRVLGKQGFASFAHKLHDEHWEVIFLRQGAAVAAPSGQARQWREGAADHIDVRGLEPPQPMVGILALLGDPNVAAEVIVHHEREPVFLYPELSERGWSWEIVEGAPGEVRLRLVRAKAVG